MRKGFEGRDLEIGEGGLGCFLVLGESGRGCLTMLSIIVF